MVRIVGSVSSYQFLLEFIPEYRVSYLRENSCAKIRAFYNLEKFSNAIVVCSGR